MCMMFETGDYIARKHFPKFDLKYVIVPRGQGHNMVPKEMECQKDHMCEI